jgi:hypothetical protein
MLYCFLNAAWLKGLSQLTPKMTVSVPSTLLTSPGPNSHCSLVQVGELHDGLVLVHQFEIRGGVAGLQCVCHDSISFV